MKEIKTVVLDIDGTLLNSQNQISSVTKDALIKIQEHGIKLILASGRPPTSIMPYAKALQMDKHHGYLIAYNGANVLDCETGEILYAKPIRQDFASRLLEHLKQFEVITMLVDNQTLYVNDVDRGIINTGHFYGDNQHVNIIEYEAQSGHFLLREVNDFVSFVDFPLFKIQIAADVDYLQAHYQAIQKPVENDLTCVFTAPFFFEFMDKETDKGTALHTVLESLGLNSSDTMAFGDAHNDLSLITYAGTGIAMANAEQEVLDIADEVTKSNNEDGIAFKLFEKYPHIFDSHQ